jgi:hypothetical protein
MDINAFYEKDAGRRLSRTLGLLARHNVSRWALTGGTAIELHLRQMGAPPFVRPLHDLDFIAASFDCLPVRLADLVISRHVHPHDPPAKTMLQAVDPDTSVRIDVFRAYGSEMKRAQKIELLQSVFQIVAFEDLVARHARLCCDLLRGQKLARKYARDFLRMLDFARPRHIESVWQEHRKPDDPKSFGDAAASLREAIVERTDLLTPPTYSTDVDEVCPRCESTVAFRRADAREVFGLLGYC